MKTTRKRIAVTRTGPYFGLVKVSFRMPVVRVSGVRGAAVVVVIMLPRPPFRSGAARRRRKPANAWLVVGDCSRQTMMTTAALNTMVATGEMPTV